MAKLKKATKDYKRKFKLAALIITVLIVSLMLLINIVFGMPLGLFSIYIIVGYGILLLIFIGLISIAKYTEDVIIRLMILIFIQLVPVIIVFIMGIYFTR